MPFSPEGTGGTISGGGGGSSLIYAGNIVSTTLSGNHNAGATTITLASVAGFQDNLTFGIVFEGHKILSVDAVNNQITIASPGLTSAHNGGTACFATPMWLQGDALVLPDSAYAELSVFYLYDLVLLSGSGAPEHGRSTGAYYTPQTSWWHSIANLGSWNAGSNNSATFSSFAVGLILGSTTDRNVWSIDYEPAGHRLLVLQGSGGTNTAVPRVRSLVVAGRSQ